MESVGGEPKTVDFPRFQSAFAARVGEIMPGTLVNSFENQKYFIVFQKFMKNLWNIYENFMKYFWILRKPPRNPTKSLNISWKVWVGAKNLRFS